MRIKLNFKSNGLPIPINNQKMVNSYIHKLLGNNNQYHDKQSDYCISGLCGGKMNIENKTIIVDKPFIIISSIDDDFIDNILDKIWDVEFGYGLVYNGFEIINEKFYKDINHFYTLTPILLKKINEDNSYEFITKDSVEYKKTLIEHIIKKFTKINSELDFSNFDIIMDLEKAMVKKKLIKNVINKGTSLHLSIKSNANVAEYLYHYGIGQSTGSGFGMIYKTESREIYKY